MWGKGKSKQNVIYLEVSPVDIQIIDGKNVQTFHNYLAEVIDALNDIGHHIPIHIALKDWHLNVHHLDMKNMNWLERFFARKHFLKSTFQKTDCLIEYEPSHAPHRLRSFFLIEPDQALKIFFQMLDQKMVNPISGITLFDIDLVRYFFEQIKSLDTHNIYAILYPHGNSVTDDMVMYLCEGDHIIYMRHLSEAQINDFKGEHQHITHYLERLGYHVPEKIPTYYMTQKQDILEYEGAVSLTQMIDPVSDDTSRFWGKHYAKHIAYLLKDSQQKIHIDPPFASAHKWIYLWSKIKRYFMLPMMLGLLIAIFLLNDATRVCENDINKITEEYQRLGQNKDHAFCRHSLPLFQFFQQHQNKPMPALLTCILKIVQPHEIVSVNWAHEGHHFTLTCVLGGEKNITPHARSAMRYKLKHFFSDNGRAFGVQYIDIVKEKQVSPKEFSLVIKGATS